MEVKLRLPAGIVLACGVLSASSSARGSDRPQLGSLWAWGWAGYDSELVEIVDGARGPVIRLMQDLSGNGNHFFNDAGKQGAWQKGLTLQSEHRSGHYHTDLPLIGLDHYEDGGQVYGNVYYQAGRLNASGPFYLASVCANTRSGGQRELFGTDGSHCVRLDQERNTLSLCVEGVTKHISVAGGVARGALLLEIWRDWNGLITCLCNGVDISTGVAMEGTCGISGFGYDGSGTSHWDDYLMEIVMCDGLPAVLEREALREYLRVKWDLWGPPDGDEDADEPPSLEQDGSFHDEFEIADGSGWILGEYGQWTESDGVLSADVFNSTYGAWATPTEHRSSEVTVSASVQFRLVPPDGSWHAVSLQALKALPSDGPARSGYAAQLRSDGYLRLLRNGQVLAKKATRVDARIRPVEVALTVYRGELSVEVDGTRHLTYVDTQPLTDGYAGVALYNCRVAFQWFDANVAPIAVVEPPSHSVIETDQALTIHYKDLRAGGNSQDPMLVAFSAALDGEAWFDLDFWRIMPYQTLEDGALRFDSAFVLPDTGHSEMKFRFIAVDQSGNVISEDLVYSSLY